MSKEIKEMVCIVCPVGCNLTVTKDGDNITVTGNTCPRGEKYGKEEMTLPMRMLTTTMAVSDGDLDRVPVRTENEIPKAMLFKAMEVINKTEVKAPLNIGDVLIENICDTGVNVIATRKIDKI